MGLLTERKQGLFKVMMQMMMMVVRVMDLGHCSMVVIMGGFHDMIMLQTPAMTKQPRHG